MLFELNEIKEAHLKVKSGADFPNYVQDLIKLGVKKYDTYVSNGRAVFFGEDNYQIQSEPKYADIKVANIGDKEKFKHYLQSHQRGESDYSTFCRHAAETGVEKWTVDTSKMTCTYYDKSRESMLEEKIPTF